MTSHAHGVAKDTPTNTATARLAEVAHSAVDDTAKKAEAVERQLRAGAEKARDRIGESQEAASKQLEETVSKAKTFVNERPVAAAGIAFAAGALFTALLRR